VVRRRHKLDNGLQMSGDGFLHRYFLNNGHKRLHKWVHYFDIYERHFERFRGKKPVMLEIGVMGGGSLAMWKEYFGGGCKVVGLDINPECKQHAAEDIDVFIGSQDDPAVISAILEKYPHIDIVLDDGSHLSRHMIRTFELLYSRISPLGVYLVEDTHANYWPDWEGGLRKSDTFMEFSKAKVDELNAVHTQGALAPTALTVSTDAIAFYDSIVVFEKRPQGFRQAPITAGMNIIR
jgi:hypothetical protein